MASRSFWLQFSIQFKNWNVTSWLKKVKTSNSVIINFLSIYNLHASRVMDAFSRTLLMFGKASSFKASIPRSTTVFLPLKNYFKLGLIISRAPRWFTCFPILVKTSKFDLSKALTVWILQSRCIGLYEE